MDLSGWGLAGGSSLVSNLCMKNLLAFVLVGACVPPAVGCDLCAIYAATEVQGGRPARRTRRRTSRPPLAGTRASESVTRFVEK